MCFVPCYPHLGLPLTGYVRLVLGDRPVPDVGYRSLLVLFTAVFSLPLSSRAVLVVLSSPPPWFSVVYLNRSSLT